MGLSQLFAGPDKGYQPPTSLELLFDEEPVSLQVFVKDKGFLNADWMLSPKQEALVKIIERVYLKSMYPLMAEGFGGYWRETVDIPMKNLIAAEWGKGGGKDSTVRISSLRIAYLLMCLKSPQRYFGMPEDDSIHLLNIAVNAPQANRAYFETLTKMVRRGWFRDRAEPKRDTIIYDKNIMAISGHSDAEAQEGLNIMLGVADEIDAFKAKGEMVGQGNKVRDASTSAESILQMLESSAKSRFPECYKRVAISYPRYQGSTIQLLRSEAEEDVKEHGDKVSIYFASGPYATWDVNPLRHKEEFAAEYRKDPDEAAAKYECRPTRATDAYFRNPIIFRQAVDRDEQPIEVSYRIIETASLQDPDRRVRGWEPVLSIAENFRPVAGARYAVHADLAIKGDRAGVAMSHIEKWEEREIIKVDDTGYVTREQTVVPILRNDFTIAFEADVGAKDIEGLNLPREIQIRWVRDLVYELIRREFYVGLVTYDGFHSIDSMQILESHGIETDRVSTDRDPDIWKSLKDIASEARLRMPFSLLLQKELEGLSRVNGKVDHPLGGSGSKDLADAFSCSLVGALTLGGEEDPGPQFADGNDSLFEVGGYEEPMYFGVPQGFGNKTVEFAFKAALPAEGGESYYG